MAANVETMFYTREKPWHGLGTMVKDSPSSVQALSLAGLDWKVEQHPIVTTAGIPLEGFWANVRNTDNKVLGVVLDKYKVVQNEEAFASTDTLLGEGLTYETAGSLQEGRKVWLLAKLPQRYIISGDEITPYFVFSNSYDGCGVIKVAMTSIRVVCNNTLNCMSALGVIINTVTGWKSLSTVFMEKGGFFMIKDIMGNSEESLKEYCFVLVLYGEHGGYYFLG